MNTVPWGKTVALWFGILGLAFANGALREALLIPRLGKVPGLVLSGAILATCIVLVAWWGTRWIGARRSGIWLVVGMTWLVLTLLFEFGFGRLGQGKTWSELLEPYIFKDGNLWPLVLLIVTLAPWCAAQVRGLIAPSKVARH